MVVWILRATPMTNSGLQACGEVHQQSCTVRPCGRLAPDRAVFVKNKAAWQPRWASTEKALPS